MGEILSSSFSDLDNPEVGRSDMDEKANFEAVKRGLRLQEECASVLEGTVGTPETPPNARFVPVRFPVLGHFNPERGTLEATSSEEVDKQLEQFTRDLDAAGITALIPVRDVSLLIPVEPKGLEDQNITSTVTVGAFVGVRTPPPPQPSGE